MTIRPAREGEAAAIDALMFRSKAAWGYDARFMELSRAALTVDPDRLRAGLVFVAEEDGALLGVAELNPRTPRAELEALFVTPDAMRRGIGASLYERTVLAAKAAGATELGILADPNAVPFYERCGARVIEMRPSDAIPGRELPYMVAELQVRL